VERRVRDPAIDLALLRNRVFVSTSLSVALAGAVFASLGGTAAGSMLVAQRAGQALAAAEVAALQATFLHSFHAALVVSAAVAALGIGTALVRGDEKRAPGRAKVSRLRATRGGVIMGGANQARARPRTPQARKPMAEFAHRDRF
jgi:hypothetical protein